MIAWLLAPVLFAGLYWLVQRRGRLQKQLLREERSVQHQVALEMIDEWVHDETIQKALFTTGTVSQDFLDVLPDWLSEATEKEVWGLVAALTRDKRVRRVIATHLERTYQMPKDGAMKALMEMRVAGGGTL